MRIHRLRHLVSSMLLVLPAALLASEPGDSVRQEVRLLADLARQAAGMNPADIAARFGNGHRRGECRVIAAYGEACEYIVAPRQSAPGDITWLEIVADGGAGSEVTWKLRAPACLTEEDVAALLGPGELNGLSVPTVVPGQKDRPPAYRQMVYRTIAQAVKPAVGSASFNGACLAMLTINFLSR